MDFICPQWVCLLLLYILTNRLFGSIVACHSQTHNSLSEWICFAHGCVIDDVVHRRKAMPIAAMDLLWGKHDSNDSLRDTSTCAGCFSNYTTNQSIFVAVIGCTSFHLCAEGVFSTSVGTTRKIKHKRNRPILSFKL